MMGWFMSFFQPVLAKISVKAWRALGIVAILVALAVAIYTAGGMHNERKNERQQLEDALDAHKRIDDADVGEGDPDVDREWLLERGNR